MSFIREEAMKKLHAELKPAGHVRAHALNEKDLEGVSGGRYEYDQSHWSHDREVWCIHCGSDNWLSGPGYDSDSMGTTEYYCSKCGNIMVVEGETGDIWYKNSFLDFCNRNGFRY